jgi:serine/threonine protein kinase
MGDALAESAPRVVGAWRLGAQIGAGSFAVVHRATHVADATLAAVKEVDTKRLSPKLLDSLAGEVALLRAASAHAHIVRLLDTVQVRGACFGGASGARGSSRRSAARDSCVSRKTRPVASSPRLAR